MLGPLYSRSLRSSTCIATLLLWMLEVSSSSLSRCAGLGLMLLMEFSFKLSCCGSWCTLLCLLMLMTSTTGSWELSLGSLFLLLSLLLSWTWCPRLLTSNLSISGPCSSLVTLSVSSSPTLVSMFSSRIQEASGKTPQQGVGKTF